MTQQSAAATPMSKEMQDCVQACMACHSTCEETMSSCLRMGGQAPTQVMGALMDCADMTRMCADMMMRRSPLATEMCAMCAQACDLCAEACMSMPDDAQMMRCAESCRRCAESCRAMAGATM
ncbi:four-helix bundle copper-binding protein [Streptomyces hirsutus]|uniref:Four-helix bundle copper-binding protein n=1 Tax=Streptomyces hirsutus TaxID=35620 RepID=A0ABZ1GQK5_9ACTN|nr:four-helix bundle copper-binding protein [Streptomyces hirsutus]WSD06998.1 four-helix bundle copper-binding protein [Streptomyces hirsutus]WTD19589.1 four-helix bundle copper-binding protein [Streptomyces hirsutus]WTD75508.1 four-helix bundle copper-binding protein [Streptomyces sp. NBC_01635]